MKDKLSSYSYLTLGMAISGSAVVVSKMMVSSLPAFLATELGLLIGLFILLPLTFLVKKEFHKPDIKSHAVLFAQALCGVALYRIFTMTGLNYTSAATSGLITSATPAIIVLFAYFLLRERLLIKQILGTACAVAGLFLINLSSYYSSEAGHGTMKGNAFILAAVLCEALFSILSKAKCKPMSALYRTTVIACYAALQLLPFAIKQALRYDFSYFDLRTGICVLYYGVFVSFLSYVFWFKGIEKLSAGNAAVFTCVVPVTSILLSVVMLKEVILPVHIISMLCIITGIWISCFEKRNSNA
jgi:drug/metabolite transporter (DMT)-like permease